MAQKGISTYYQYKTALTEFIAKNGNGMLTDRQIQQFIFQYDLESKFGITVSEVRKDAQDILKQIPPLMRNEYQMALRTELLPKASKGLSDYDIERFINSHGYKAILNLEKEDVRIHLAMMVNGSWTPLVSSFSKVFQTNQAYQKALRNRILPNSKEPLSETSIKVFIKRGGFDKTCNLDVETVKQDMYALPNQFNVMILNGANAIQATNTVAPVKKTSPPVVELAKAPVRDIDDMMLSAITAALQARPEFLKDRQRLTSVLKDVCPEKKREINILLQAYDLGIVEEIRKLKVIDSVFISRFTNKMVNDFGTSEVLAEAMVLLWCFSYGRDILRIECQM